jgi:2-aminobenzoate-CoA ligase
MPYDRFVLDRLPPGEQWPQWLDNLPAAVPGESINAIHSLWARAEQAGWMARPLLRSPHEMLSYAQTRERVDRLAAVLTGPLGLTAGQRVLLRGANAIELAVAWLAVVQAGLVAVCTMPLLRAKELGEIIEKSQPALALCDVRLLDELKSAHASHPGLGRILTWGSLQSEDAIEHLMAQTPSVSDVPVPEPGMPDDPVALLAFTSGTTGSPKAAVHTHRDLLAACEAWPRHVLQARPDDIVMGSPPLAFTFGLGGLLLFPLWAGASVYYPDGAYTPARMVELMANVGCTICYTAPTFYRQMAPLIQAHPVPSLRISVSAGEALPDATRQLWKAASGLEMLDGIGATEMFHIFISAAGTDVRPGAIGKVVPGYQARVVDEQGHELPRGTVGRLAVIGPTGCRYLNDPRQTKYVRDGWNFPGDTFMQDDEGYFYYQARDDDMIITAGYNVGGPEVEDALLLHPAVAECGVVAKPDDERGMIVKAYCVLRTGFAASPELVTQLQDHVKAQLAPYKYPREIEFVTQLPRTETGKLQRFRLRQMAQTSH